MPIVVNSSNSVRIQYLSKLNWIDERDKKTPGKPTCTPNRGNSSMVLGATIVRGRKTAEVTSGKTAGRIDPIVGKTAGIWTLARN